jgi:hypothetical protein
VELIVRAWRRGRHRRARPAYHVLLAQVLSGLMPNSWAAMVGWPALWLRDQVVGIRDTLDVGLPQ